MEYFAREMKTKEIPVIYDEDTADRQRFFRGLLVGFIATVLVLFFYAFYQRLF